MKYDKPYVAPTLTVDAVIFQITNGVLEVLLMKRPNEPFKGEWALPGGYNAEGETTTKALHRIVEQKTGIDIDTDLRYIEQLYTFDTVARDPRGLPLGFGLRAPAPPSRYSLHHFCTGARLAIRWTGRASG